jgi:hypothetical protein
MLQADFFLLRLASIDVMAIRHCKPAVRANTVEYYVINETGEFSESNLLSK